MSTPETIIVPKGTQFYRLANQSGGWFLMERRTLTNNDHGLQHYFYRLHEDVQLVLLTNLTRKNFKPDFYNSLGAKTSAVKPPIGSQYKDDPYQMREHFDHNVKYHGFFSVTEDAGMFEMWLKEDFVGPDHRNLTLEAESKFMHFQKINMPAGTASGQFWTGLPVNIPEKFNLKYILANQPNKDGANANVRPL